MASDPNMMTLPKKEVDAYRTKLGIERKEKQIQKEEEGKNLKGIDDVKKELTEIRNQPSYKKDTILQELDSNAKLRRTFIAVTELEPARIGELRETYTIPNSTLKGHLKKLAGMGLISKFLICRTYWKIAKKIKLDQVEERSIKKFEVWIKDMNPFAEEHFFSVTPYWRLTKLGQDKRIINLVLNKTRGIKDV